MWPVELIYPVLLDQLPAPRLRTYPPETVIAEKFEAMVKLGLVNSRMKDFFDIWILSRTHEFDLALLAQAAQKTFSRRGTMWPTSDPLALTEEFSRDPNKQIPWNAFLNRTRAQERPSLDDVVQRLHAFLGMLYTLDMDEPASLRWYPGAGGWST